MILPSTALYGLIDLGVVLVLLAATAAFTRLTRVQGESQRSTGDEVILAGLLIIIAFHVLDLAAIVALPPWLGEDAATRGMGVLRQDLRWILTLAGVALVCAGLLMETRRARRAAADLAAREAQFRSIVQEQKEFIVRWQPGGLRTWVNEPYCRLFGIDPEAAIGTSFFDLIGARDRKRIAAELEQLTPESPARTGIHEVVLPGGRSGWQEWTDYALFDDAGELIELQSVGRDVTDRIRAEQALATSEARFRDIVENTTDWVWEIDLNGRHTYSNGRVEEILGYSVEELFDLGLDELLFPEQRVSVLEQFQRHVEEKRGWHQWVVRFRHRDGGYRCLESTADPVFDDGGRLTGFRGIDREATFNVLMAQFSSEFIGQPAGVFKAKLMSLLESIGVAYGIDRISYWMMSAPEMAARGFEWARPGMGGPTVRFGASRALPRAVELLTRGEVFCIENVADLAEGSPERSFLERQNIKSTLAVPTRIDDEVLCAAVFSTITKARVWPSKMQSELRVLLERILSAYLQAEANETIARHQRDLEHSEALARVGSYAFYPTPSSGVFPDGWEASFSEEHCALLACEPEEATFELAMSRIHPDDRERVNQVVEKLVSGESRVKTQYRIVNPDGELLHLVSSSRVDHDANGNIVRIVGATRDITEQVMREQSLQAALDQIEQLKERVEEENVRLRQEIRSVRGFEQIVGESDALREPLSLAARAAPTDASILILGETGTGKELLAKAIHELSPRSQHRLVSLNCSAIPAELVESELFGHERGAFTGAHQRRIGRFEMADKGTLFLDEIAELPPRLQGKLLRVLQDGEFERVGGTETIRVDIRLIAATNRDIRAAAANNEFRADLFYRINTVTIELPPLRDRKGDIPILAHYFVRKHAPRFGKSVEAISTRFLEHLEAHDWPGNIRELEHEIESALISSTDSVLALGGGRSLRRVVPKESDEPKSADLRIVEKEHIVRVLRSTSWQVGGKGGAAEKLGMPPSTLRSRMKKLGIDKDSGPHAA